MEKEYRISFGKILGITLLIAVVVIIICLLYPKKNNALLIQDTYIHNMALMKDAGYQYFSGKRLPQDVGSSKRITLEELLTRNLVIDFVDEEGNSCNTSNSYIEATKVLDDEYEMSVYLSCNNKTDYIIMPISNSTSKTSNSTLNDEDDNQVNSDISSTNTNKKPSTSTSSSNVSGQTTTNTKEPSQIIKTTNVNITYVSSCLEGDVNCKDDCLTKYHSVTFNANGGESVRTQIVKHGDYANFVDTYRYGYTFKGWYLNGTKFDFSTPIVDKITLVAKWEKIEKPVIDDKKEVYVVDFESNGGSRVASEEVIEGEKVTRPENPVKECYRFVGWYTDKELTKAYDFNQIVTSDMKLYAKWRDDNSCLATYTVRFDSNGGSSVASQRVLEGKRASEPRKPTKDGYTFKGWYLNGKRFDFDTKITRNITLEAKWSKDEELYYEYCLVENKTYYSISYVSASKNTWDYSWTARFYDLDNILDLKVVDAGYVDTNVMYQNAYQNSYDKGIVMVGSKGKNVAVTSGTMLKTYSLKPTNFSPSVSRAYYKGSDWYVDLSVHINHYRNVNAYYAKNISSSIYFVPFYFTVEYTNLDDCVHDKASRDYKYDDYKIVDKYWK